MDYIIFPTANLYIHKIEYQRILFIHIRYNGKECVMNSKIKLTTGEKLKDLRIDKGFTSEELCKEIKEKCGYSITKSKYNEIENDKEKDFGYKAFIYLAKYYNVSVDWLLGLSPNPTTKEDKKTAIKVTGLSEKAINSLKSMSKCMNNELNFIIENNIFEEIVMILYRARCKQEYLSGNNTELALQAARSINLIDELGENQSCDALSLLEAYFPTFTDVQFEISALGLEPLYKQKLTESMIKLFDEYKGSLNNDNLNEKD